MVVVNIVVNQYSQNNLIMSYSYDHFHHCYHDNILFCVMVVVQIVVYYVINHFAYYFSDVLVVPSSLGYNHVLDVNYHDYHNDKVPFYHVFYAFLQFLLMFYYIHIMSTLQLNNLQPLHLGLPLPLPIDKNVGGYMDLLLST